MFKDVDLQQAQHSSCIEYKHSQHIYFSIEVVASYHNPKLLFITFLIGLAFLFALIQLVRWPEITPLEHSPLKVQLIPSTTFIQKPEQPLSLKNFAQEQPSQQQSSQPQPTPENSKPQKALAQSQAKPVQPDKTAFKENKPPQTEPPPNPLPLKARLFDTLQFQESHQEPRQALDQAPRQDLFNNRNQNRSNAASSSEFVGGNNAKIQTYQAQNGDTMVAIDGRCYRVFDDELSPTGKSWSLPTRCSGHKTESDRITEGLRKAMQERFGNR